MFVRRDRGFTLLEVVFAASILAIGALMLSAALSTTERMNSMARERAIANNCLRSYIERMRRLYPLAQNDVNMVELVQRADTGSRASANDTTSDSPFSGYPDSTPIFDLVRLYADNSGNGFAEKTVLKNATAKVYMCTDETGTNWGPCCTASLSAPATVSTIASSTISTDDKTALGLPRDLNGDGSSTTTDTVQKQYANVSSQPIVLVPVKVQLTWTSGTSAFTKTNTANTQQTVTMYALFSMQH